MQGNYYHVCLLFKKIMTIIKLHVSNNLLGNEELILIGMLRTAEGNFV